MCRSLDRNLSYTKHLYLKSYSVPGVIQENRMKRVCFDEHYLNLARASEAQTSRIFNNKTEIHNIYDYISRCLLPHIRPLHLTSYIYKTYLYPKRNGR